MIKLLKRLYIINWFERLMLLIQTNKVSKKGFKLLIDKYLISVSFLRLKNLIILTKDKTLQPKIKQKQHLIQTMETKKKQKNFKRLICKSYFSHYGSQNYLIFQPFFKCFQTFSGTVNKVFGWKSKGKLDKISQLLLHQTIVSLQNLLTFKIPKQHQNLNESESIFYSLKCSGRF